MRVLAVGNVYPPHDQAGGYEAVWLSAMEHLVAEGHEIRVLASDFRLAGGPPDEARVFRELQWYWRDHAFPRKSAREALALERHNADVLNRHLAEFAPDVVTWWSMGAMSMGLLELVRQKGLPAVAFVHDDWLDYGRRADAWHRRFRRGVGARLVGHLTGLPASVDFATAARYAFVSAKTHKRAEASGLALPDWTVVHSGIGESFLDPAPEHRWTGRLLYVGRIDPRKGIETAVRALAEAPSASLEVAGIGPVDETQRLEDLARDLGVSDRLHLLGARTKAEIHDLYGSCDAVLFPVEWEEPWGLVPLEAMARGRPVIATGRGGSGEYLRDEENCLLFRVGDASGLAAAVRRLSSEPELLARLRASGLETAPRHTEGVFNVAVESELHRAAAGAGHGKVTPVSSVEDSTADLHRRARELSWYHTIELAPGLTTDGWFDVRPHLHHYGLPERMDGMRALDVGTWDGFWAFEMERRGAEVVALDVEHESEYDWPPRRRPEKYADIRRGDGFRLAREILGSRVERVHCNIYEALPENVGTFDLVFVGAVIVHLRDQLLALERLANLCHGRFIFADGYDRLTSLLPFPVSRYHADRDAAVVFWMPSRRTWKRMLWTAGFDDVQEKARFTQTIRSHDGSKHGLPHFVLHAKGGATATPSSQAPGNDSAE